MQRYGILKISSDYWNLQFEYLFTVRKTFRNSVRRESTEVLTPFCWIKHYPFFSILNNNFLYIIDVGAYNTMFTCYWIVYYKNNKP